MIFFPFCIIFLACDVYAFSEYNAGYFVETNGVLCAFECDIQGCSSCKVTKFKPAR